MAKTAKQRKSERVTLNEQGVKELQARLARHKWVNAKLQEEGITIEEADIVCYPDGKLMWKSSDIVSPFYIHRTDGKVGLCVDLRGRIIGAVTRFYIPGKGRA